MFYFIANNKYSLSTYCMLGFPTTTILNNRAVANCMFFLMPSMVFYKQENIIADNENSFNHHPQWLAEVRQIATRMVTGIEVRLPLIMVSCRAVFQNFFIRIT